jgi:hypothetical protein
MMFMRQGLILTGLGIAVWGVATLFFRIFGGWLLAEPADQNFGSSLFLLELLTLLVLIGMALIVRLRLFPERGSAIRFGFIGASVGLLLDTFTIMYRDGMFPDFTEGEHHTFTIWMTLGYALMLIVPAAVDILVRNAADRNSISEQSDENENEDEDEEDLPVADADR